MNCEARKNPAAPIALPVRRYTSTARASEPIEKASSFSVYAPRSRRYAGSFNTSLTCSELNNTGIISAVSASAIDVHDLRKSYGEFEAVRGIDFQVRRGEVFGLLG